MACCNVWDTARLNFGTTSIQHFLADLFLIHSDIDVANFADDNVPHLSAKNVEDVIESLERASVSLFRWFENNSKVNSKVLSLCVNMLKHAYAPTHLLFFTIFWCIFIVYTLINGLIHCISSIISSSFFTSNEFTLCSINSKVVLACP